jgi:hypothetical protein
MDMNMNKSYKERTGGRSPEAYSAKVARSVKFHDRREARGGARNQLPEWISEYQDQDRDQEEV